MATKKGIRRRSAMQGGKEKPRLGGVSLSELKAEIRRRERQLAMLHRKRDRLLAELESLEQEIATQAARTVSAARAQHMAADQRKRPKNTVILVEALKRVLKNQTLSVSDAAGAVQRAGYRTSSENFRTIVNQTLIGNRKRFKKISRGMYTAR